MTGECGRRLFSHILQEKKDLKKKVATNYNCPSPSPSLNKEVPLVTLTVKMRRKSKKKNECSWDHP